MNGMCADIEPNQEIIRYFLGGLPEAEQLRLEERFFTDDEYFEKMLALEDALRYDYAQGRLFEPSWDLV